MCWEKLRLSVNHIITLRPHANQATRRLIHYGDVIMGAMASQITSLQIFCSSVYSGAAQRKHQSSASLVFVRGIHRWPVNSPRKRPVTRKMFPFDDVIVCRISLGFETVVTTTMQRYQSEKINPLCTRSERVANFFFSLQHISFYGCIAICILRKIVHVELWSVWIQHVLLSSSNRKYELLPIV